MRRRPLLFALGATFGLWGLGCVSLVLWLRLLPPDAPTLSRPEKPPELPAPVPWLVIPDRLESGEALAAVLHRNGFADREVHDVAKALSPHIDLRELRPGDKVEIHFGRDGAVASVRLHRGAVDTFQARRDGMGWRGEQVPVRIDRTEVARRGTLRLGGSLSASMEAMDETAPLIAAFAEVFAWDFDFFTQSQPGDRFYFVVEKLYREGEFVGYGDLLAARYVSGKTDLAAFLYEEPTHGKGYYDRNGNSMRKAFLRAPLKYDRISSRFSYSRLHPIYSRRMPHLGVDYAAPVGTPVLSVASGVVVDISRAGGGGNSVTLRHAMGYGSKYLHLSRFAGGLHVGKRVEQKEVIGYVGSSGIATGPHLDFRLSRYGKPVNPLRQIFPPGPPVPKEQMPEFQKTMVTLTQTLEETSAARVAVQ